MKIRIGTIDEALLIEESIPEFISRGREYMKSRLDGKDYIILVAEIDGKIVGLKMGYFLENGSFYSWVGGVLPDYRKRGIAKKLAIKMEGILKERGCELITMKTRNKFREMIIFAASNGFNFVKVEEKDNILENRIYLEKKLI